MGGDDDSGASPSSPSPNDDDDANKPSKWSSSWPPEALAMARTALDLTRQDWTLTGQWTPKTKPSTTSTGVNGASKKIKNLPLAINGNAGVGEIAERIVALLLIRIVALTTCRLGNAPVKPTVGNDRGGGVGEDSFYGDGGHNDSGHSLDNSSVNSSKNRPKLYSDYSTTTICRAALPSIDTVPCRQFPACVTPAVLAQLRHYVRTICHHYRGEAEVPYHNVEHAYHVFLSANKLLDLMLCESEPAEEAQSNECGAGSGSGESGNGHDANYIMVAGQRRRRGRRASTESMGSSVSGASARSSRSSESRRRRKRRNPTFGIKSDPLSQLALLFSALVHDVDHTGISNRQLVLEMDDLAILYNDQSVAEQRSLAVAFTTLKQERYTELREVLFPPASGGGGEGEGDTVAGSPGASSPGGGMHGNEDFFKFRKLVIDLVLVTDIASPERTQIVKSKWKEAFGEVIVAEKLRKSMMPNHGGGCHVGEGGGRKGSGAKGEGGRGPNPNRRISFDCDSTGRVEPIEESEETETDETRNIKLVSVVTDGERNKAPRREIVRKSSQSSMASGGSGPRREIVRKSSQNSMGSGGSGRRNARATGRASSQRSMVGSVGGGLQSSLLSALSADADSIRDSLMMDDDTIDFSDDSSHSSSSSSSSSSLISDIQSPEDDFNTSAVSRTKMNFDTFADSFNTITSDNSGHGAGSADSKRGELGRNSGRSTPLMTNSTNGFLNNRDHGKNETVLHPLPNQKNSSQGSAEPRDRWSTGDLADDLDEDMPRSFPGRRQRPTSPPPGRPSNLAFSKSVCVQPTPTLFNNRLHSLAPNVVVPRRKPSAARVGHGLSQSMLTHRELRCSGRRRVQAEERRLGIRRALDLSGSTIAYSGTLRGSTSSNEVGPDGLGAGDADKPDDDVDEFKATVVLEQMIRAADVAALLQDWNNMMKWSTRLYKELKNGFLSNRGEDPSVGWYENQIKFFDFYILPLAKNLGVMGVFEDSGLGEGVGNRRGSGGGSVLSGGGSSFFVNCVKSNLARWIEEGSRATELMMKEDEEKRLRERELCQRLKQQQQEEEQWRRQRQELEEEERRRQVRIGGSLTQPMASLGLGSGGGGSEINMYAEQQHDQITRSLSVSHQESLHSSLNSLSSTFNAASSMSNNNSL